MSHASCGAFSEHQFQGADEVREALDQVHASGGGFGIPRNVVDQVVRILGANEWGRASAADSLWVSDTSALRTRPAHSLTGTMDKMVMTRAERREAADLLRRVLDAVDRGDLSADGPAAVGLLRRLEGALLALGAIDGDQGALIQEGSWSRAAGSGSGPR